MPIRYVDLKREYLNMRNQILLYIIYCMVLIMVTNTICNRFFALGFYAGKSARDKELDAVHNKVIKSTETEVVTHPKFKPKPDFLTRKAPANENTGTTDTKDA